MSNITSPTELPEYNVTGQRFDEMPGLKYAGPVIDAHTHVLRTRPTDPHDGPPSGKGPGASVEQAEVMLSIGEEYNVVKTYTMCFPDDVIPLREHFGDKLEFIAMLNKGTIDEPDDAVFRRLDQFLEGGATCIKFWAAPRGRDRGLLVDAPWRMEAARRAQAAGVRVGMVHVADPDVWFEHVYTDQKKYGTKAEQYPGLHRVLEEFSDMKWIGAHMGGDPEHPDHLQELLETYPHFCIDTSATKWQVREVSPRRDAIRDLICRFPTRFLWGTDLVTKHHLHPDHYRSRYWCQRMLWDTAWRGQSPIADPDHVKTGGEGRSPILHGVDLPLDVLERVNYKNAVEVFGLDRPTKTS